MDEKIRKLCKGKYFKVGLVASVVLTAISVWGIVDTAILNGGTWVGFLTGLVVFAPFDIAGCGMILVRTAMIDADIKNSESRQDNKFDINKIPDHMKINDGRCNSLDEVKIYTVSPKAIGLCGLSTLEQNTETKRTVKIRKRTRDDFN